MMEKVTTNASGNILINSGLNFHVEKLPHYRRIVSGLGESFKESVMSCGIFRTDTGQEIGDVKKSYEIAQTDEILYPFLHAAQEGHLIFRSGRAIDSGRQFTLSFDIGQKYTVHGETLLRRVIVGGSHDGSWSTFIKSVVLRQVCTNGMMGLSKINGFFKIKHTANWRDRYNDVLLKLAETDKHFADAFAKYETLFEIRLNRETRAILTRQLLDIKPDEKTSTRKINQFSKIMYLSERGKGIAGNSEILDTGAAWYNAVAEYVDHYTNKDNAEKQFVSAFFGHGETRKHKAFELVSAMA